MQFLKEMEIFVPGVQPLGAILSAESESMHRIFLVHREYSTSIWTVENVVQ